MAEKNTESTAVNQLIELVSTARPLAPDPDEDLMFRSPQKKMTKQMSAPRISDVQPLPRARAPIGTQQGINTIKAAASPKRVVTIPPVAPPLTLESDFDPDAEATNPGPSPLPIMSRPTKPTLPPPLPTMRGTGDSRPHLPRPSTVRPSVSPTLNFNYPVVKHQAQAMPIVDDPVLAASLADAAPVGFEVEISTQHVAKQNDWKSIASKLVAPMVVLVVAGIFIGGYFAFDGDGGKKTAASGEGPKVTMPVQAAAVGDVAKSVDETPTPTEIAPAAAPTEPAPIATTEPAPIATTEPASVATTEPAPTTAEAPKSAPTLVDVRVDSNPSGATVNLIDRGKSVYLGTTPLSAAVDVSRKYELVFSYENRSTAVEALDPSTQKRVSVRLHRSSSHGAGSIAAPPVETAAKVETAKIEKPKAKAEKPKLEDVSFDAPKAETPKVEAPKKAEAPRVEAAKPQAGGEGTLMISSKPPCEILVDGKPTGLTTPQRAIALPAGAHKITLVNTADGIKKTVSVQITADKPTKVIQDFMK